MGNRKRTLLFSLILAAIFILLPGRVFSAENNTAEKWTVTQYGTEDKIANSMFYAIKGSKGHLILIDSGVKSNVDTVRKVIEEEGNGKVDLWIITHPHSDHVGGFISFTELGYYNEFDIRKIIYQNFPAVILDRSNEIDRQTYSEYKTALKEKFNSTSKYKVGKLKIEFVSAYSRKLFRRITQNKYSFNTYSGAFMVSAGSRKKNRMFFAGDINDQVISLLLKEKKTSLKSKYIQAPHHGKEKNCRALFKTIKPSLVLIDHADRNLTPENISVIKYLKKHKIKYKMLPYEKRSIHLN